MHAVQYGMSVNHSLHRFTDYCNIGLHLLFIVVQGITTERSPLDRLKLLASPKIYTYFGIDTNISLRPVNCHLKTQWIITPIWNPYEVSSASLIYDNSTMQTLIWSWGQPWVAVGSLRCQSSIYYYIDRYNRLQGGTSSWRYHRKVHRAIDQNDYWQLALKRLPAVLAQGLRKDMSATCVMWNASKTDSVAYLNIESFLHISIW